jgi:drug/metabolite transporter (DMT)-like permease
VRGQPRTPRFSTASYTTIALVAFAGNSLLTRSALDTHAIDAMSFMSLRLIAGAITLILLTGVTRATRAGSMTSAIALAGYALGFTAAYAHIPAGIGALLLFGSVQITMFAIGVIRGERPHARDWLGLAVAMSGLWYLTWPSTSIAAPDAQGSVLMLAAGACWGIYSARGRSSPDATAETAGNFARAVPIALVASLLMMTVSHAQVTARGALLAIVSGAITSGLAYSVWYAALPGLATWTAAIVQLAVPVMTAVAATWLLGEAPSARLLIAGSLILGGVLIATSATSATAATSTTSRTAPPRRPRTPPR